jgi:hypothetical protein
VRDVRHTAGFFLLLLERDIAALGLMMIGLAKNGTGSWDIAMNVDIDSNRL